MTAAMRLYQLPTEQERIAMLIEDAGGELTPELEAMIAGLEETLEKKVQAYCMMITQYTREADMFNSEIERLEARMRTKVHAAENLKKFLKQTLEAMGRDSVKTDLFNVRIQKNSRPIIRWQGSDDNIPEIYKRTVVSLDGNRALADLKEFGSLPDGFVVETGSHLRIQ